ncbi:MAG: DUF2167 domain-containing protein [Halarcobacter sp.]
MRFFIILTLFCLASFAQTDYQKNLEQAYKNAEYALYSGPQDIKILDQSTLALPSGFGFVPKKESLELLKAMGNTPGDEIEGIIFPLKKDSSGFIVVSYIDSGYIKDDEAKQWDANELLTSLKEGTKAGNSQRIKMGVPPIEVLGWITSPQYNAQEHKLIWSAKVQNIGSNDSNYGINYNTYILGREGYISMNFITDSIHIEAGKPIAKQLLSKMNFDDGKTYSDFNADTDKVAEYGLAALIAGVAAKKLGLLAVITAFAIKFWKVALLGFAFLYKPILNIFKRKKEN